MKEAKSTHIPRRGQLSFWAYAGVIVGAILLISLLPGGSHLRILIWPVLNVAASIWLFRRYKAVKALVIVSMVLIFLVIWAFWSVSGGMSVLGY